MVAKPVMGDENLVNVTKVSDMVRLSHKKCAKQKKLNGLAAC
jgi:hypothetical protein